jgi:hypothetical protein
MPGYIILGGSQKGHGAIITRNASSTTGDHAADVFNLFSEPPPTKDFGGGKWFVVSLVPRTLCKSDVKLKWGEGILSSLAVAHSRACNSGANEYGPLGRGSDLPRQQHLAARAGRGWSRSSWRRRRQPPRDVGRPVHTPDVQRRHNPHRPPLTRVGRVSHLQTKWAASCGVILSANAESFSGLRLISEPRQQSKLFTKSKFENTYPIARSGPANFRGTTIKTRTAELHACDADALDSAEHACTFATHTLHSLPHHGDIFRFSSL